MVKTIGVPSNKKQMKRAFSDSIIGPGVRADDTTAPERVGTPFAPSVERVLDHQPGFGKVKPTEEIHQKDKGLKTLSSDSRNAPLPEGGVTLDIHGRRRDENVVGRSSSDKNDDNTVYGEDRP